MTPCYPTMLRAATRRVTSIYDQALIPFGVNIAQYSLLSIIGRLQPVSFTDLARAAQLDRSTIGRNVRVLERQGLVAAVRSGSDMREAMISLSSDGAAVLSEARPRWETCQREIEAGLGAVKVTAMQDILRSI